MLFSQSEKHLTFQSTTFGRIEVFSLVVNEGHYDILNTCDDDRLVVKAV